MVTGTLVAGIILAGIGAIFIVNNKALGEGMSEFYRKLYTKKNTPFMFKAAGILLLVGGAVLASVSL